MTERQKAFFDLQIATAMMLAAMDRVEAADPDFKLTWDASANPEATTEFFGLYVAVTAMGAIAGLERNVP